MSSSLTEEIISEDFVIQGILKEMIIAESLFFLPDSNECFKLLEIVEEKIRGGSLEKTILLKSLKTGTLTDYFIPEKFYSFKAGFYRSQIEFKSSYIEFTSAGLHRISIPNSVKATNYRKQARSQVKESLQKPAPLLIQTSGLHCEGTFIIEDTSSEGIGGILHVPHGFPLNVQSTILGELILERGEIRVRGKIARAIILPETKNDFETYRVGIIQMEKPFSETQAGKERRKSERLAIKHTVELTPLMHPDYKIEFDLADISINGFSGKPSQGSVLPCIPIGSRFKLEGSDVRVELVHFNDEVLRFNIENRNEKDSIEWFRTMTPVLYKGATCTIRDARDLYKIFLQAGAISSQYLKRHSFYSKSLTADQADFVDESGYLHRWYVGDSQGEIVAHISAVRNADNCWILGDIAKVSKSDVKGESLVKSFFHSFSELCSSITPCPSLMIMWTNKHPLWNAWDRVINSKEKNKVISSVLLQYHRLSLQKTTNEDESPVRVVEIKPKNYKEILEIEKRFENEEIKRFAKHGLDFDYTTFSSPRLTIAVKSHFSRGYFLLKCEESEFLAVTTKFPPATSFNRITDSIYLFPLQSTEQSEEILIPVRKRCYELSISLGLNSPSIRVVFPDTEQNSKIDGMMQCYVLMPEAFGSFEGFK